jgi:hypothetical protein
LAVLLLKDLTSGCDSALGGLALQFGEAGGNLVISYQPAGVRLGAGGFVSRGDISLATAFALEDRTGEGLMPGVGQDCHHTKSEIGIVASFYEVAGFGLLAS